MTYKVPVHETLSRRRAADKADRRPEGVEAAYRWQRGPRYATVIPAKPVVSLSNGLS